MLTITTVTSQLEEALNINQVESVFSRDYHLDLVNQQRVLWMRNEYNKTKRSIDPNVIQNLGCVEMEVVDSASCCSVVPVGCKILRSKYPIPNSIEFYSSKALTDIGPVDLTKKRFTYIEYKRVEHSGSGRYGANMIYTFLYDKYLYVYSKMESVKLIESIRVRGVFEDPLEAIKFSKCAIGQNPLEVCLNYEEEYPLNMWMWEYIRPIVVEQMMRKQAIPQVQMNNAKDNKTEPSA